MIIATIPESTLKIIKIPAEIKKLARGTKVFLIESNGIFSSNCFLSCREARPHTDSDTYYNMLLLTLSLKSSHSFGDKYAVDNQIYCLSKFADMETFNSVHVPRGALFIIDSDCLHWLFPPLEAKPKIHPFICLQWEVNKADPMLADKIKVVVRQLNGECVEIEDERYKFLS